MNLPDVKGHAHGQIDKCSDEIVGMVQIIADADGQVSTCIAGFPDAIIQMLAETMRTNYQVRDLIGAAWLNSGTKEI